MELRFIEVSRIVEDPEQPRRALDDSALAGLADSIRQHGVLNPITVAPLAASSKYTPIASVKPCPLKPPR